MAETKFRPLGDKVLIKVVEAEETTSGGIILPDTAKEKPQKGEVVAVGAGKVAENGERVAPEVKVGDKVIFAKYGGSDIKLNGVDHKVLTERDILAIVE